MTNRLSFMTKPFVINRLEGLKAVVILPLPDFFAGGRAHPLFCQF